MTACRAPARVRRRCSSWRRWRRRNGRRAPARTVSDIGARSS